MRISDWSSDVCSSDLQNLEQRGSHHHIGGHAEQVDERGHDEEAAAHAEDDRQHASDETKRKRGERRDIKAGPVKPPAKGQGGDQERSEEHTSELQSLMRLSYADVRSKTKTNTP